jgi:hypothetical protein
MNPDYDRLLKLFVSDDEMRPYFMQPNTTEGWVWATDAHSLIRIPEKLLKKEYPSHAKVPNVREVWDSVELLKAPKTISCATLLTILGRIDKEPDTSPCPDCEGAGYIECLCCGHCKKCPACKEEGSLPDYTKPEVYPCDRDFIRVLESNFSPRLISRLEEVARELEVVDFALTGAKKERAHQFSIGPVDVILMPMLDKKTKHVLL